MAIQYPGHAWNPGEIRSCWIVTSFFIFFCFQAGVTMFRRIVLLVMVTVSGFALSGCGGPGEVTSVPAEMRVGLGAPGSDGPGHFKDPLGNDMPTGLAPMPE
jgi:hypothetical protein